MRNADGSVEPQGYTLRDDTFTFLADVRPQVPMAPDLLAPVPPPPRPLQADPVIH